MRRVVMATYDKGLLKPAEDLPLADRQRVLLVVVSLPETNSGASDAERLETMETRVATWLAEQPLDAVRTPLRPSPQRDRQLDARFDAALAAVRKRSAGADPDRIAADIAAALAEARAAPAGLDAELEKALEEWLADAS
jgi:predicted DNA-binding antitoxin AbrB/MazE fold protein